MSVTSRADTAMVVSATGYSLYLWKLRSVEDLLFELSHVAVPRCTYLARSLYRMKCIEWVRRSSRRSLPVSRCGSRRKACVRYLDTDGAQ